MVAVNTSRLNIEILGDEGTVCDVTREDVQVGANMDGTEEVRASRLSIEVLGEDPKQAGVTREDVQVAGEFDGTDEVQTSRLSIEVLAEEVAQAGVTREDVMIAGQFDATGAEIQCSRVSIEVLARQGSAGPVDPLALPDDAHVFLHNWATQAKMTSSFRTSVVHSPDSGADSRRGLTLKPFRTLDLEWMICAHIDLARLERIEVALRRLTDQRFPVPIYMDQRELDAAYDAADSTIVVDTTKARFFLGQRVAIVQVDKDFVPVSFSFHIIEGKSNNSLTFEDPLGVDVAAGSLVFPMMDCEVILEVEANYQTARVPVVKITMAEAPGASQLPPLRSDNPTGAEIYNGRPIWYEEPDWVQGITKGRSRYGDRSDAGRADFVNAEGDRSRQVHKYVLTGKRDEMWNVLEFFETRRGRLRSFWHIDQDQYFETVDIDPTGTFISVAEIGDLADFQEEFEHVGIIMNDGMVYVREAVTIDQVLTVFRITMDDPIDINLDPADVARIARARLSRFESDAFTETWQHTNYMNCGVEIIEVLNEEDFPTT